MIEIQHLSKSFGNLEVLKDVSLTIKKGEVVTIIGSSGSGKSTLLRCINLLEQPTGGAILFEGKDIVNSKIKIEDIRKNACMVFQHFNLFANMTVLENMTYAPRVVNGLSKQEAKEKANEILESARKTATLQSEKIVKEASEQAAALKNKAEKEIAQEKKKAVNEVKGEIGGIAMDIAGKVIEREINEKDHEKLIDEFISNVGEAS